MAQQSMSLTTNSFYGTWVSSNDNVVWSLRLSWSWIFKPKASNISIMSRLEFVGIIIPWNKLCVECTGLIIRSQSGLNPVSNQQIYPFYPDNQQCQGYQGHCQVPNIIQRPIQRPEFYTPLQCDIRSGKQQLIDIMFNSNIRPISYLHGTTNLH